MKKIFTTFDVILINERTIIIIFFLLFIVYEIFDLGNNIRNKLYLTTRV